MDLFVFLAIVGGVLGVLYWLLKGVIEYFADWIGEWYDNHWLNR